MEVLDKNTVLIRRSNRVDAQVERLNGGGVRVTLGADNPVSGEFVDSGVVLTIPLRDLPEGIYVSGYVNRCVFDEDVLRGFIDKRLQYITVDNLHVYHHAS